MPVDPTLLEPFEKLIPVTVEGKAYEVPANNTVLRVLQCLDVDLYPCRLCWNGDCDNCRVALVDPATGEETTAKGCETTVCPGMNITHIPPSACWPRRD